jgi:2-polyprenyl-3-methyl-5-hydroxy-6-metoxy-1,4-benzoquinol methylase
VFDATLAETMTTNHLNPPDPRLEWTDELVSSFWRFYAQNREQDYFTGRFGDRILDVTSRFIPRDALVCDYGCGAGFLLEKLVRRYRAAGCDFTPANVEAARRRVGDSPNLVGTFTIDDPALSRGGFDAVYFVETVEHLLDHHVSQALATLGDLLKPGGVLIATTPHDEDLDASMVYCPCCSHLFHRWQHVRSFTGDSLAAFMAGGGFEPVSVFTTDFTATTRKQKLKAALRPSFGRKNPHLVYVGRKRG